jgi:hypothetical protein
VQSSPTGEDRQVLVVPVVILVEYDGDALRFVAPCTADDRAWTVPDRLDELPAGAPAAVDPLARARASPPDIGLGRQTILSDRSTVSSAGCGGGNRRTERFSADTGCEMFCPTV